MYATTWHRPRQDLRPGHRRHPQPHRGRGRRTGQRLRVRPAGSVWTDDVERGTALARRIRTGTVGIKGYRIDNAAPVGGYKASGLGARTAPRA
ncbi:aldehyde dehydrogenase family protein [Streptomyces coeruleorubidus]|uniref:aldehyde dehydrogenase family protein n=1 Tax=Streptomyces coeruleorubidus TaxID=116188 RepID=UPI0036AF1CBB